MKRIALAVLFFQIMLAHGHGQIIDLTHDHLTPGSYNPASILMTANRLIAAGEATASSSLMAYNPISDFNGSDRHEYATWLCVLVYEPKPGKTLPVPLFGIPRFPFYPKSGADTTDWPKFPLLFSKGVPFYFGGGYANSVPGQFYPSSYYVKFYHENGVFRTTPYIIPTRPEARVALNEFLASPQWKALDWSKAPLPGEAGVAEAMRQQVERVPVGWKIWQAL